MSSGERLPVSCTVISKNEEDRIAACLESVAWCDEIVLVDSLSTDRTVEVARRYTQRIIPRPWEGYVAQKRFALGQTRNEWVLNLDADERVSPALCTEIAALFAEPATMADGYYIPRLVYYLGRWWYGGWYPGYRLRLFRKSVVAWGGVDPHERVILHGRAARLRSPIVHFTYRDISDQIQRLNDFTDISAQQAIRRGKSRPVLAPYVRSLWRMIRFGLLRGGLRMGIPGLFVTVTHGFYGFVKWAKVDEQRQLRDAAGACGLGRPDGGSHP